VRIQNRPSLRLNSHESSYQRGTDM
jgi:hypothetical protein